MLPDPASTAIAAAPVLGVLASAIGTDGHGVGRGGLAGRRGVRARSPCVRRAGGGVPRCQDNAASLGHERICRTGPKKRRLDPPGHHLPSARQSDPWEYTSTAADGVCPRGQDGKTAARPGQAGSRRARDSAFRRRTIAIPAVPIPNTMRLTGSVTGFTMANSNAGVLASENTMEL